MREMLVIIVIAGGVAVVLLFGTAELVLYRNGGVLDAVIAPIVAVVISGIVIPILVDVVQPLFERSYRSRSMRAAAFTVGVVVLVTPFIAVYMFFVLRAFETGSDVQNAVATLESAFSAEDPHWQRQAIDETVTRIVARPNLQERVVERIKQDPRLLKRIEPFLWRLAREDEVRFGALLGHVSSKSDPVFLAQSVRRAAELLDNDANWRDPATAAGLYAMLQAFGDRVVPVLTAEVTKASGRLQVLFLAVKLGIPGSEQSLARALDENGDKQMAEDYLNSGSGDLADAARRWVERKGYTISEGRGSHRANWGNF